MFLLFILSKELSNYPNVVQETCNGPKSTCSESPSATQMTMLQLFYAKLLCIEVKEVNDADPVCLVILSYADAELRLYHYDQC